MRISTVFELLLIFVFIAFAASRHIDKKKLKKGLKQSSNFNPYCTCTTLQCNCCRDFPVVPIKGPGCASLGYQTGDALRLTMSFGDRVLRNITLVGKRPKPVCMGLPGGVSKFCGRLYNIERLDDHFKACLALELRALDELEAAMRVSCFNFGPKGVKLEPGQPIPSAARPADEDDDDDDYDIDDDDDDDDDEFEDDDDEYNDVESGDYTGFAALSDQIFEGFFFPTAESSGNKKKKPVRPVVQQTAVEVTTKAAVAPVTDKQTFSSIASSPLIITTASTPVSSTERQVETTTLPLKEAVSTNKTSLETFSDTEKVDSAETMTEGTSTESITTVQDERENETDDSESEEDVEEQENETEGLIEKKDEDANEGSAEDELDESENEEESQGKVEDDEEEDEGDDDDESEEDHDSSEQDSQEDKDEDKILNVFFNHDEDSNETERERTRMEREKFKKILPGLMALLQPSPTPPTDDLSASFAFPSVRSARVHRRMRLPPI